MKRLEAMAAVATLLVISGCGQSGGTKDLATSGEAGFQGASTKDGDIPSVRTGPTNDGGVPSVSTGGPITASNLSRWMSDIPAIERATLGALTLPGTHDSQSYWLGDIIAPTEDGQPVVDNGCDNLLLLALFSADVAANAARSKGHDFGVTQNHSMTVREQLRAGIRFLDIRVVFSVDGFYAHHGLLGVPISTILSDIRSFLENDAGPREVVLLSLTAKQESRLHYQMRIEDSTLDSDKNVFVGKRVCEDRDALPAKEDCGFDQQGKPKKCVYQNMSFAHQEQLNDMVEAYLGGFLFKAAGGAGLDDVRIGDITAAGPKVVTSFDMNGKWANKDTLDDLRAVQRSFIDGHIASGDPASLLELQWVLTAQSGEVGSSTKCWVWRYFGCDTVSWPACWPDSMECPDHRYDSIHDLSRMVNPALDEFVYAPDQAKINSIRMDFFDESPVVKTALDHPVAVCRDVTVAANERCEADASVDDGSSDDTGPLALTQAPPGPYSLGGTSVKLTASDGKLRSSCGAVVSVADVTAPVITKVEANPRLLWPPDHRMVPITVQVVTTDNCDSSPTCRIAQVRSNEPVGKGRGSGNTEPDWLVTGDLGLVLRAERSGASDGRIYDVLLECVDKSGNKTAATFTVEVAHSMSEVGRSKRGE